MRPHLVKDVGYGMAAGAVATAASSVLLLLWHAADGLTSPTVIVLLAQWLEGGAVTGWTAHAVIGVVLWGGLFALTDPVLPGNASLRGLLFAFGAWLVLMLILLPWTGGGVFAARLDHPFRMIAGSLALHGVYGWVLGFVFGRLTAPRHAEEARARGHRLP